MIGRQIVKLINKKRLKNSAINSYSYIIETSFIQIKNS